MTERSAERAVFLEVCEALGSAKDTLPNAPITGFMAMVGAQYSGDLMWVGRAVNGWTTNGRTSGQLADRETATGFVNDVVASVTRPGAPGHSCPMRWVSDRWGAAEGYNTKTSAFWRTASRVIKSLAPEVTASEWPSYMIWSNLYKLAPAAGWNPGSALAAVQLEGCRRLLALEVAMHRPRNIVFATGNDWAAPFLDSQMFRRTSAPDAAVVSGVTVVDGEQVGRYAVARHPMG